MKRRFLTSITIAALSLAFVGCHNEQRRTAPEGSESRQTEAPEAAPEPMTPPREADETSDSVAEAEKLVSEAAAVVEQMRAEPGLDAALAEARAVLIAPEYGKAAVGVGVRGGEAVLVVRTDDGWGPPAFYNLGAVSVGPQLGAAGGDVAMLIMSEEALDDFRNEENFSFDADAGLTLVDFSEHARETWGRGEDLVFWSGTEGAFAGVSLGVSEIDWDDDENPAYYGSRITPEQIVAGTFDSPEGAVLTDALPG